MKRGRFGLGLLGMAVALALIMCAGLLPAAADSVGGDNTVGMMVDPTPETVTIGDDFSVAIKVTISAGEAVNVAEAYMNYDPAYLEGISITAGTSLPTGLKSSF